MTLGGDARAEGTNLGPHGALDQVIPEAQTQSNPCSSGRDPFDKGQSSGCRGLEFYDSTADL